MAKNDALTQKEKDLMKRYLVWCYKTTKESLDKIDRYFTQLVVDDFIITSLKDDEAMSFAQYSNLVNGFQDYMEKKKANALPKKFKDEQCLEIDEEYLYLKKRFAAIEKAICHFFDEKELAAINKLYEEEMTDRILKAREHR